MHPSSIRRRHTIITFPSHLQKSKSRLKCGGAAVGLGWVGRCSRTAERTVHCWNSVERRVVGIVQFSHSLFGICEPFIPYEIIFRFLSSFGRFYSWENKVEENL